MDDQLDLFNGNPQLADLPLEEEVPAIFQKELISGLHDLSKRIKFSKNYGYFNKQNQDENRKHSNEKAHQKSP